MIQHGRLQRSAQGFTLIEIMIVVFIIGLMAGVITLSIGEDKSKAAPRVEAQALMESIGFVTEYATLNGEVIGMFIRSVESKDTLGKSWCYSWQRQLGNGWSGLPEDSLTEHCMPINLQWELEIDGHLYVYDPDLETQPPVVVFSPSGEATPVEMALFEQGAGSEPQHINIDMMGDSHWREQDEARKRDENAP